MMTSQIGRRGIHGVLNGRWRCGSVCRRIMTPRQTRTKAKSVPMLVSSTILSSGEINAKNPTNTPVQMVVTCGVRYFGWMAANFFGSRPSRDIEKKIRGCPYWKIRRTAVIATTAPNDTHPAARFSPMKASAFGSGSATPRSCHGLMPTRTAATAT